MIYRSGNTDEIRPNKWKNLIPALGLLLPEIKEDNIDVLQSHIATNDILKVKCSQGPS